MPTPDDLILSLVLTGVYPDEVEKSPRAPLVLFDGNGYAGSTCYVRCSLSVAVDEAFSSLFP